MLVFDTNKFGTKRELDSNGYLRVSSCNITKTQIRPYLGHEIPGWRDFGLEQETIYNVYCPEEELKKALESFNNLPLTREHIEVDVENVPKDKIVGSLGDHVEYKKPYVKNSLIVYDKKDIDWILSGKKKELSCGYRYTPVRQSGEFDGKHYDFVMTDIIGNHVALVREGRAGHDVMVADENLVCDYNEYHDDEGKFCCAADASVSSKIDHILKKSKEEGSFSDSVTLGKAEDWLVKKAAERGLDIEGYEHALDVSAAKHIHNKHGDVEKEALRGQIAITDDDIRMIPDIVSNPDMVVWGNKNRQNKDTIVYAKRMDDGSVIFVEEIRTKRKTLSADTMWKKKGGITSQSLLSHIQQHLRSDNPTVNILAQDSDNVNREFNEEVIFSSEAGQATEDSKESTVLQRPKPLPDNSIVTEDNKNVKDNFADEEDLPNFTESQNDNTINTKENEMITTDEFKEADHPRDKDGKFTSAGVSGSFGEGEKKGLSLWTDEEIYKKYNEGAKKIAALMHEGLSLKEGSEEYKEIQKKIKDIREEYKDFSDEREKRAAKTGVKIHMNGKMEPVEKKEMTGDAKLSEAQQEKVGVVMKEFKEGTLKSGSGEKVTDPAQAKAIALSEARKEAKDKEIPEKAGKPEKAGDEVALNQGETKMAEEVKEALAEKKVEEAKEEKVAEDACGKAKDKKEVKPACDEKEDKRKLIDEIGGILKGKLSEEDWRTVIKKAEELAYNDSERSADDEKKDDLKGKEKKAFAEGVEYGEKKEKAEPKKLDSEHESEGMKKAEKEMAKDSALAMDVDAIKAQVREEVMADFKAREEARKAVRGFVGDVNVMAFDSAEDIYKFACGKSGMDLNEIVSFKDAFKGLSAGKSKVLALDASPVSGSNEECLKDIRIV